MELKGKKSFILIIAVLIFAALSAYTTAIGVSNIWQDVGSLEKNLFSWGFAIATSCIMVYLILQLPGLILKGKGWLVFISYMIIALISIFFNFNAFLGSLNKTSIMAEEVRVLQSKTNDLTRFTETKIRERLKIQELQSEVDKLKAAADSEEYHNLRPGKGPRHQKIKEKLNLAKKKLETAISQMNKNSQEISKINSDINNSAKEALEKDEKEDYVNKIEHIKMQYNILLAAASRFLTSESKKMYQLSEFATERLDSPEQSLKSLFNLILNYQNLKGWQRYSIFLALFLALVLDLPIFLALFVLHMGRRGKSYINIPDGIEEKEENKKEGKKIDPFIDFG